MKNYSEPTIKLIEFPKDCVIVMSAGVVKEEIPDVFY